MLQPTSSIRWERASTAVGLSLTLRCTNMRPCCSAIARRSQLVSGSRRLRSHSKRSGIVSKHPKRSTIQPNQLHRFESRSIFRDTKSQSWDVLPHLRSVCRRYGASARTSETGSSDWNAWWNRNSEGNGLLGLLRRSWLSNAAHVPLITSDENGAIHAVGRWRPSSSDTTDCSDNPRILSKTSKW